MTDPLDNETPAPKPEENPSLRASINDGVSCAVMMGGAEAYFGPFGIFLHASTLQVGLLASCPQLFGALLQWAGAINMDRIKSRRRFVLSGAAAQAVTLLPMALLPFLFGQGTVSVLGLLGLIMLYQAAGGVGLPAWNSLMGDLVPADIRGRYFGHRNRLTGMSSFFSLIFAGLILDFFARAGIPRWGFVTIFVLGFLARLNSVHWLARYKDPAFSIAADQVFTFGQFLRRSPHSNFAKFVFFIGAINLSVAFSAPYFALYMLRDLKFSYIEFTVVTGMMTITQFLTFRYWGAFSDRFGNKKILNVCGLGVAVAPMLWLVSHWMPYLMIIQVFCGVVWSGFNIASSNFLFDAVTPPKRARCVAYQSLVNGVCVFIGSLAGGVVAAHLPHSLTIGRWTWAPAFMLPVIFFISSIMRLIASGIFLRKFKEVRTVEPIRHRDLVFRISHIRPIAGASFSLMTGLFRERRVVPKADGKGDGGERHS